MLYDPFWEAVMTCGLKVHDMYGTCKSVYYINYMYRAISILQVLGATLDGKAVNRRLIKLHKPVFFYNFFQGGQTNILRNRGGRRLQLK